MKKAFLLFFSIAVIANVSYGQKAKYQSLFIYNFTKYVKWPDSYNPDKFVIGVLGNSEVLQALESMAASKKKSGTGQMLEVKEYKSVGEIQDCNILFVSENMVSNLGQVESKTSSEPVLIITDSPGMAKQGSIINFVEKGGKIKFELNESKASSHGLVVSSSLASLAIII